MDTVSFLKKVRKKYPIFRIVHKAPCRECPFRKLHAPGWLGPDPAEAYEKSITNDLPISCHLTRGRRRSPAQCAGSAILYRNELRSPRPLDFGIVVDQFEPSTKVFAKLSDFMAHHRQSMSVWIAKRLKEKR